MFPFVFLRFTAGAVFLYSGLIFLAIISIIALYLFIKSCTSIANNFKVLTAKRLTSSEKDSLRYLFNKEVSSKIDIPGLLIDTYLLAPHSIIKDCCVFDVENRPDVNNLVSRGVPYSLASLMATLYQKDKSNIVKQRESIEKGMHNWEGFDNDNPRYKDRQYFTFTDSFEKACKELSRVFLKPEYKEYLDKAVPSNPELYASKYFGYVLTKNQYEFCKLVENFQKTYSIKSDYTVEKVKTSNRLKEERELKGMLAYQKYYKGV